MARKKTVGQYAMGIDFNPSGDPMVDKIKAAGAKLYDMLEKVVNDRITGPGVSEMDEVQSDEIYNRIQHAKALLKDAVMNGVAAQTKPPR